LLGAALELATETDVSTLTGIVGDATADEAAIAGLSELLAECTELSFLPAM
jgi:hypothetical protein